MSTTTKQVPIEQRCETCWDFNETVKKGVYREEYQMVMCIGCLRRTKRREVALEAQTKNGALLSGDLTVE
jgi:hypothetical protein